MTRRVGRTLLALLLLLVVAIGLCEWAGWPFLRGPIERAASNALGRTVFLGEDFRLRVFGSIRFSSDVVKVEAAEGAPLPETDALPDGGFLHATNPRVKVPYATVIALVRGPEQNEALTVTALEIDRLDLALARTKDGKANWEFGDPAAKEEQNTEPAGSIPPIPRFERLVVRDGHVALDDEVLDLQLDASIRTSEFGGEPQAAGSDASAPAAGASPGTDATPGTPAETAATTAARNRCR
jgi:hypothetical protein